MQTFFNNIYGLIILAAVVFIGILICPFLIRCIGSQIKNINVELRKVQLETTKNKTPPPSVYIKEKGEMKGIELA